MKNLFNSVFTAIAYIIAILILGMFVPFIVSTICYWTYPTYLPFREFIANAGFIELHVVSDDLVKARHIISKNAL